MVFSAIQAADIDMRPELYKHIGIYNISIYLSICLFIFISIYLSIYQTISNIYPHLSTYLSIYVSIQLHLIIYISISISIYIYLSIGSSIWWVYHVPWSTVETRERNQTALPRTSTQGRQQKKVYFSKVFLFTRRKCTVQPLAKTSILLYLV